MNDQSKVDNFVVDSSNPVGDGFTCDVIKDQRSGMTVDCVPGKDVDTDD